jgi:protein gp37
VGIKTEIAYCDSTVNPVVGCDGCELHRAGCTESHCYAAGLVERYKGLPGWPKSFDVPEHFAGRLDKAIGWPDLTGKNRDGKPWLNGYPRLIFMCDLADPFSESLDPEWLTPYLPRMADSPHVYIMLTKRGRRMLSYWQKHEIPSNVWQGVSVTGPGTLARAESLLEVPGASVRFISAEPLLGRIDLDLIGPGNCSYALDWLIVGAESGAKARRMELDWARELRDQATLSGVAFFFKQECDERGRKLPGRLLNGREWSGMPKVSRGQ